jgi:hypothetical protein
MAAHAGGDTLPIVDTAAGTLLSVAVSAVGGIAAGAVGGVAIGVVGGVAVGSIAIGAVDVTVGSTVATGEVGDIAIGSGGAVGAVGAARRAVEASVTVVVRVLADGAVVVSRLHAASARNHGVKSSAAPALNAATPAPRATRSVKLAHARRSATTSTVATTAAASSAARRVAPIQVHNAEGAPNGQTTAMPGGLPARDACSRDGTSPTGNENVGAPVFFGRPGLASRNWIRDGYGCAGIRAQVLS